MKYPLYRYWRAVVMTRTCGLIALLTMLVLQTQAQVPAWKTYYDSAQAFWAEDWPKTVLLLKQAEKFAANDLGIYDPNYLTIANDLGLACWRTRAYGEAEKILKETLATKRQVYAPSDPEIFRSVSNLAGLYAERGDHVPAKQLYRQIISAPAAEQDVYWKAVKNMMRLYETHDDLDSALQLVDKLDAMTAAGKDPAQTYETRLARGRINRKLRKYDDARTILERMIGELQQQREPLLSSLHVQALQEAGLLYLSTGSFNQAEKNILQGFRLIKTLQLTDAGLQTEVLNNLASVYEKLNIYDKATVYYQEALDL
ncbi:MAG TPA: tetratricopeptide repeat protein, partial [Ohtaekwangia sp.]|nr:tetratricopeptide repeat protein [Ohtaekwangia sp.]